MSRQGLSCPAAGPPSIGTDAVSRGTPVLTCPPPQGEAELIGALAGSRATYSFTVAAIYGQEVELAKFIN